MDISTLKERLRGIARPTVAAGTAVRLKPDSTSLEDTSDLASGPPSSVVSGPPSTVVSGPPSKVATGPPLKVASGFSRTLESLGGAWRETGSGRSFVISQRFAPDDLHGRHRVVEFAERLEDASPAASLVGRSSAAMPFVFFDLETTGLNGGAGTLAFLVGCGWFDDQGGFITEQHLLTHFTIERSMLDVVAEDLRRAGTLMSFNGKSFDAPMLETRYLFHRLESPCANRPHVDLVHPARRFWGQSSQGGCSLGALEQQQLGVHRRGDVAGIDIPARYFRFVRT